MISYKRDVLERQSLSEVKIGRGSPICERVHTKIVEHFKTTFLNAILQRLCQSHHLQWITSSKDSEKLEKSLCVRDKAEDLCWNPRILQAIRRHCITHRHYSVIDISKWAPEYFQKPLTVNNLLFHLKMPIKALSSKKEPICEDGTKAPSCPMGQGSFKMDCFKVEKCSMVRRVQI